MRPDVSPIISIIFFIFIAIVLAIFTYMFISEGINGLIKKRMRIFSSRSLSFYHDPIFISGTYARITGFIYFVIGIALIIVFSLVLHSVI